MKFTKIHIITIFFIPVFMCSCVPNVVFDQPMPSNVKALESFPDDFQGRYVLESDSSIIYIKNNLIIQEKNTSYTTLVDEMVEEENCSFIGNEIFFADTKECHPFEYLSEDSIKILNTSFDTLFQISEKEVVKPYKGSLFFNIQGESEYWITLMLDENNSGHLELRLFHIEEPLLLSDFKGKYEVINDASFNEKYLFSPNKKVFKSLVEIIAESETFEKLIPVNEEYY